MHTALNKLTDKSLRTNPREKPFKLSDGGGLFLLVQPDGRRYWRLAYRFDGKQKLLALGVYPEVTLAEARLHRDEARKLLAADTDPGEVKKQSKRARHLGEVNAFEAIALEWWDHQRGTWSDDHARRVRESLEREVFPCFGSKAISTIQAPEVLDAIRAVERRGALDVASRLLQRVVSVFRYAIQTGRATYNPAADLSGTLKVRKVEHQPSLPRAELPEFFKRLRQYDGYPQTLLAFQLLLLTFIRPGELRGARWKEFDIERAEWRIPAERMKMKTEHVVPLSTQAIAVLAELKPLTGSYDLLFPGERKRAKPISENTLTFALYRMGYKGRATAHGFRATASSILNEEGFNRDAIERQLAHVERNKVRGAYTHHAEYLVERRQMMQWWADYLDTLKAEGK